MPSSTLTSKGQTTIPAEVRARLGLEPGDRIDYVLNDDGTVVLKAATIDIAELAGLLAQPGRKPRSVEQMDEGIRMLMKRRHGRSRR
jgi:antitoxin PrlF